MKAHQIRNVLDREANHIKGANPYAGAALQSFSTTATDAELIRFREIVLAADRPVDWLDPTSQVST